MAKNKSKSIFESLGWKIGMKYLYGWGAAIVIVGALFKILHLPGANEMLIVGLGTEAVIFFFSAFEPLPHEDEHWEWDKVFPVLRADIEVRPEDIESAEIGASGTGGGGGFGGAAVKLDEKDTEKLVEAQKKLPQVFEALANSVNGLKSNVDQLADITDTSASAQEFSSKLKAASGKIDQLSSGYSVTIEAMKALSGSVNEVKAYQDQVKANTANLSTLNKIYETELQETKKQVGAITQYYAAVGKVMQNLADTSKDTDSLRQEVTKLATNMKSLNTIYGNMLTAMRTQA